MSNQEPDTREITARVIALLDAADPAPWHLRADTPWGSKVIMAQSGEMYLGVSATTSPPGDGWHESARIRARDVARRKCANAELIAAAPKLLVQLVAEVERLTARVEGGWQRGFGEGWTEAMDHIRKAVGP